MLFISNHHYDNLTKYAHHEAHNLVISQLYIFPVAMVANDPEPRQRGAIPGSSWQLPFQHHNRNEMDCLTFNWRSGEIRSFPEKYRFSTVNPKELSELKNFDPAKVLSGYKW